MAKVTKRFEGVPDGEYHGKWFEVGDEVIGDLGRVAVEQGWAKDAAKKKKRAKSLASAPKNKSGPSSQAGQAARKKTAKKRTKKAKS